ncbi:MAG: sulfite exporter TauE/SafE family protein, partial [Candidatus Nanopelagicales bacterium]
MFSILIFAIAGAIAQLVDGTLGMAFGITSSTLLIALGATPVAASAAVHFAEIGTTLASGTSHWLAGNVDKRILIRLAIPGGIGAFLGATLLSSISLSSGRVYMSTLLLVLGLILLIRFGVGLTIIPPITGRPRSKLLVPLGSFAGFIDASGGGGWGPVTTPTLLTVTKTQPRRVIGTVSASEFVVAISASAGFIFGMSNQNIDFQVVGGLLLGGVLMAPIAAKLAGKLPHAP